MKFLSGSLLRGFLAAGMLLFSTMLYKTSWDMITLDGNSTEQVIHVVANDQIVQADSGIEANQSLETRDIHAGADVSLGFRLAGGHTLGDLNGSTRGADVNQTNTGVDGSQSLDTIQSIHADHYFDANRSVSNVDEFAKVRWVLLVHLNGNEDRYAALRQTWFQKTSPLLGLAAFGVKPKNFDNYIPFLPTSRAKSVNRRMDAFPDTRNALVFVESLFPNAEYFTKSDDDTYIYTFNMGLRIFTSSPFEYAGYVMSFKAFKPYAAGGPSYTVSRQAVTQLANCTGWLNDHEDVSAGMCMKLHGTRLNFWQGLHNWNPWRQMAWEVSGKRPKVALNPETVEGYLVPLSYHYVSPSDMLLMHDDFNNLGNPRRRTKKFPRIIHRFISNDSSCQETNPNWKHNLWSLDTFTLRAGEGNSRRRHAFPWYNSTIAASFEILMTYGGIFVDESVRCLRSLDELVDEYFDDETFNLTDGFILPTGVLGFRPINPTAVALVSEWIKTKGAEEPSLEFAANVFARLRAPMQYLSDANKYFEAVT